MIRLLYIAALINVHSHANITLTFGNVQFVLLADSVFRFFPVMDRENIAFLRQTLAAHRIASFVIFDTFEVLVF